MDPHQTLAAINHNPLNLRPLPGGQKWNGQVSSNYNSVSGNFCVFENNVYGVRAAVINMQSQIKTGIRTLGQMINRWAPPVENNVSAYLDHVLKLSGLYADYDMSWMLSSDASVLRGQKYNLAKIVAAMNIHEAGGATVDQQDISEGIDLALHIPKGYVKTDDGNVVRSDISQSGTVKAADNGVASTSIVALVGTAAPVMATVAGASWEVAAIMCGTALLVGLGVAIFFLLKAKRERIQMHTDGIA